MGSREERDAWLRRVLGIETGTGSGGGAQARGAGEGREKGRAKGRVVAYRQLLLRWRSAQQGFDANLKSLGAAVLAHPEVQADPRIAQIRQAVAALPQLVPAFGGALEDLLDAAMNTSDPAELARLAAQSATAIDDYRRRLAATERLGELEAFAQRELGAALALRGTLDAALVELKQELAA